MTRKIPMHLREEVDRKADNFLHYLKGCIMVAGGAEMDKETLLDMTLRDMIDSFYPNGIEFKIKFKRMKKEHQILPKDF